MWLGWSLVTDLDMVCSSWGVFRWLCWESNTSCLCHLVSRNKISHLNIWWLIVFLDETAHMLQGKHVLQCSPEPGSPLVIWATSTAVCWLWSTMTLCIPWEGVYTFWRFNFMPIESHYCMLQLIPKKPLWNNNRRCRSRNKRRNRRIVVLTYPVSV